MDKTFFKLTFLTAHFSAFLEYVMGLIEIILNKGTYFNYFLNSQKHATFKKIHYNKDM
jgi:hypothetical protein